MYICSYQMRFFSPVELPYIRFCMLCSAYAYNLQVCFDFYRNSLKLKLCSSFLLQWIHVLFSSCTLRLVTRLYFLTKRTCIHCRLFTEGDLIISLVMLSFTKFFNFLFSRLLHFISNRFHNPIEFSNSIEKLNSSTQNLIAFP